MLDVSRQTIAKRKSNLLVLDRTYKCEKPLSYLIFTQCQAPVFTEYYLAINTLFLF